MKPTTIICAVVILCLAIANAAPNCGSLTCNTAGGDRCCQQGIFTSTTPTCYRPSNAQCLSCTRRSSKLCGVNDRCCSDNCYSPLTHTCTGTGSLCPLNMRLCRDACYDPLKYGCNSNNQLFLLAPSARDACPGQPGNQCGQGLQCCPNERTGQLCFNPTTSYCCNSFDVNAIGPKVCPKGQTCCLVFDGQVANNVCYNPNTHYCDISLQKLCPRGTICT
jgi:hypothetical protein